MRPVLACSCTRADYADNYSRVITIRQLNLSGLDRLELEAKLEAFSHLLLTDPTREDNHVFPLEDVAKKFFTQGIRQSKPVVDDLSRLFCSKTVAVLYKHIGLLSKTVDANSVFPKHFGQQYDKLMKYDGGKLGKEVDISFEPKALRNVTSALLHLPKSAWGALTGYERAVAILQNAARRWVAKRRIRLEREKKEADLQGKRPLPPVGELRARFANLSSVQVELAADYEYAHADYVEDNRRFADRSSSDDGDHITGPPSPTLKPCGTTESN